MQVHAHPDDEASKGAGTTAKYAAAGVRCTLVTCTGGEAGEVLNPAFEHASEEALATVRMRELDESARVLGYAAVHLLGYHDSGMPGTEHNARADNFANAPFEEAVERLVALIRAERPDVIITYADDRKFYPHPDHIRVHDISGPAFAAAADPSAYPAAGAPWQAAKLYYVGWSRQRVEALHRAHEELGLDSPYAAWFERPEWAELAEAIEGSFTTFIDVSDFLPQRRAALLAHRTQIDPEGHWMRLPEDAVRRAFPYEEYVLARSLVETRLPEDDLFSGIH